MFPKPKKYHCGPSTAGDKEKEESHRVEDKGEMIKGTVHQRPGTEFILVVKRRHHRVLSRGVPGPGVGL